MKGHLRLSRRSVRDWARWRAWRQQRDRWHHDRCHHEEHRLEERRALECWRCAQLEGEIARLRAELACAVGGERVVVVYEPPPMTPTGDRVARFVNSLVLSFGQHPAVWAFILVILGGVLVTIVYNLAAIWSAAMS